MTEINISGLLNGLISQGTGTRNDTNLTTLQDGTRHNTNLTLLSRDHTRTVGTDQTSLVLSHQSLLDADHVMLRNTFSDGNNQGDFSLNGIQNSLSSSGRRDVDDTSISLGSFSSLSSILVFSLKVFLFDLIMKFYLTNSTENGETEMSLASLLRGDTTNHLGTILDGLLRVESTLFHP